MKLDDESQARIDNAFKSIAASNSGDVVMLAAIQHIRDELLSHLTSDKSTAPIRTERGKK